MWQPDGRVVLLFPPPTEAWLFPYLSLPMLTGYLRQRAIPVVQRDLNLELAHALFTPESFADYLRRHAQPGQGKTSDFSLRRALRLELAQYLVAHAADIARDAFDRAARSPAEAQRAIRFVRLGVELLLEDSLLVTESHSFAEIGHLANRMDDASDFALCKLRELVYDILMHSAPRIIGISIPFYSQMIAALHIAQWAKAYVPSALVVFGGQQMMLYHEHIDRIANIGQYVDGIATGAGEETLACLWEYSLQQRHRTDVPGLRWLDEPDAAFTASTFHIRHAPPPDFSDLRITQYVLEEVQLPLLTCVGCFWGRCIFCSYGNRSRREGYQQKSAAQIAHECEVLVRTYGVQRINFVDEMTNLRVVVRAMRQLQQRGIAFRFSVRARFEQPLLDIDFCRELRQLGCVLLSIGYETNSQRLIDLMHKGVRVDDYQRVIDNLYEVGINLRLSIMGGILDETEEERRASEAFLARNEAKIGIDVMQMLVCEAKSVLAEHPEAYGMVVRSREELRGNRELNYGQGRMGYAVEYADGATFEERLNAFKGLFDAVVPQGNDERKPRLQRSHRTPVAALQLFPWVTVIEAPPSLTNDRQRFVVDLLWQNVYRLPSTLQADHGYLTTATPDDLKARYLLGRLHSVQLGTAVRPEATRRSHAEH